MSMYTDGLPVRRWYVKYIYILREMLEKQIVLFRSAFILATVKLKGNR